MKAIIYGASGMIGGGILRECLKSRDVDSILSVGRKKLNLNHRKLTEIQLAALIPQGSNADEFQNANACFFCIGATAAGKTELEYTKLTYDLTLDIARALSKINPNMTFIYISGVGADSSETSKTMWERVRGKTENDLFKLPFKNVFVFRPSVVEPKEGVTSQTSSYRILYSAVKPLLPLAKRLFPSYVSSTENIGKAAIQVSKNGYQKKILTSMDFNKLASEVR